MCIARKVMNTIKETSIPQQQQQHTISNLRLDMFQCLAPSSPRTGCTTVAFNLIVHLIAFAWKRRHLFHPLPSSRNADTVPGVPPSPHPNHPLFREKHKAAKLNQPADYFYHYQEIRVAVNPDASWTRETKKLIMWSQKGTKVEGTGKNLHRFGALYCFLLCLCEEGFLHVPAAAAAYNGAVLGESHKALYRLGSSTLHLKWPNPGYIWPYLTLNTLIFLIHIHPQRCVGWGRGDRTV